MAAETTSLAEFRGGVKVVFARCVGTSRTACRTTVASVVLVDHISRETVIEICGSRADSTALDAGVASLGGGVPEIYVVAHIA